jgi:hypothetical protein
MEDLSWKVEKIQSKVLNEEIGLRIYLPDGYEKSNEKYSVLYLAPNWELSFPYVVGVTKFLSAIDRIPKLILVSVDCNRWRDMTPSVSPSHGPNTGHADNYLNFLENELFHYIEKEYKAKSERIFWSHSIGGAFGLYALLSKPDLFQYIIASSPWFPYELDEEQIKKYGNSVYEYEKGFILKNFELYLNKRTTQNNFLYMSIGNEPELMPYFDELVKILEKKSPIGLKWKTSKWPNESHQSMYMYGLETGLMALYSDMEFH